MKAGLMRVVEFGIEAIVYGERRLERSESGWPIVAISQLLDC